MDGPGGGRCPRRGSTPRGAARRPPASTAPRGRGSEVEGGSGAPDLQVAEGASTPLGEAVVAELGCGHGRRRLVAVSSQQAAGGQAVFLCANCREDHGDGLDLSLALLIQ